MKAFLASIVAIIVISLVSAWVLGGIESSAADAFHLKDNVRL